MQHVFEIVQKQLENQFLTGGMVLVVFTGILALLRNMPKHIGSLLQRRFVTTVDVTDHDAAFFWIQKWLGEHPYTKKARLLTLSTRTRPVMKNDSPESAGPFSRKRQLTDVIFSPAPGRHLLRFNGHFVLLTRIRKEGESMTGDVAYHESLTFHALSRQVIQDLIYEAREAAFPPEDNRVAVLRAQYSGWKVVQRRMPREPESVILDADMLLTIVKDLRWFFDSLSWYAGKGIPYQRGYLFTGPPGNGKCLGRGTLVLMFDGTVKPVESIRTGDQLMGPDSKPRKVLGTTKGRSALYSVNPVKGDPYIVNDVHVLSLKMSMAAAGHKKGEIVNIGVQDYLAKSAHFKAKAKGWRTGVGFKACPVPLDPYFMGLWLGDGTTTKPEITTTDHEIVMYLRTYCAQLGLEVKQRVVDGKAMPTYYLSSGRKAPKIGRNPIVNALARYKLTSGKHIPYDYLVNSREARLRLLAGLMDSDGSWNYGGYDCAFACERLAEDLTFLARSLGLAAYKQATTKRCCNVGYERDIPCWRVTISGDMSCVPVLLKRKKCAPRRQKKDVLRTGITVAPAGVGEYFGFELEGDGLFLLGDFTVTHNTSLVVALASLFDRDIYILSLSTVTDHGLVGLMADLPEHAFVLIEDIDRAFQARDRTKDTSDMLTFSGFLNAIDGVSAPPGRVLFMTTNHPETLDAALLRPGRADQRFEFRNASAEMARKLFLRFFPAHQQLAIQFEKRMLSASRTFSMAELQEHLIKHRDNPEAAVAGIVQAFAPRTTAEA